VLHHAQRSSDPPPVLFLVRVVRDQFSFYSTRMSDTFLEGIADYYEIGQQQQVTNMYRLVAEIEMVQGHRASADGSASAAAAAGPPPPRVTRYENRWQFRVPADRQVIIEVLDRFRQAMLA
jgi:hypothetical protein